MDKKTTYIIAAAVLIIVVGGFWYVIQNSTSNIGPVDNPAVSQNGGNGQSQPEIKSETQVAKEMNGMRVTVDDNNQSMSMTLGKSLVLMLGTDYDWTIASSNEQVLSKSTATISDARVQAVYKALTEGNSVLTANGTCAKGKTCKTPTIAFKYTVDVIVSDNISTEDLIK